MIRVVKWIVIIILDAGYRILRPVVHFLFTVAYWSRGRTVPPVQDPILKMSATELARQIREGKLTSETVVRSFADRILEVEPFINATVECRFRDAFREAQEVDALIMHSDTEDIERLSKEKPLLGVPVTIKVLLTVKGMLSTAGALRFRDIKAQEDAASVTLLKKAGAIVLATTNTPDSGLHCETNNFVHGTTCNPYDTSKTSGGSSGGESAVLAAAGSVIGLGNDLAGSIRIPCMFTGIFGHKPSKGLVSNNGCFPVIPDKISQYLATGPMCRYAEDLEVTMRVLSSGNYTPRNSKEQGDFKNVKIYYLYSFGKMSFVENPEPEIQDAVKMVVSHFEKRHGSISDQVDIPLLKLSNRTFYQVLLSNVSSVKDVIAGKNEVDERLELLKSLFRQSNFTFASILAMNAPKIPLIYDPDQAEHFKKLGQELEKQFSKILDNNSVLILPTLPFAAPYHNEINLLSVSICYTSIFNVVGLPVTQCPVTLNKRGLPIGVQVVGRHGNDALTVACAIELEKAFGGWIPPK